MQTYETILKQQKILKTFFLFGLFAYVCDMEAAYLKKLHAFIEKQNVGDIPTDTLTNDVEKFERAIDLLQMAGVNCTYTDGFLVITPDAYKHALTIKEAVLLIRAGVLKQCPPKPNAHIIFPYSETVLEIKNISKSFVDAARMFDGEVSSSRYTGKSKDHILSGDVFITDHPLIIES